MGSPPSEDTYRSGLPNLAETVMEISAFEKPVHSA